MSFKKMALLLAGALGVGLSVIIVLVSLIAGSDNSCGSNVDNNTATGDTTMVPGDWNNKDSTAYKNMQKGADFFKGIGFSGNNTAAVLAIGWRESNWSPQAVNNSGGVKGIFQWGFNEINGNRYKDTEDTIDGQLSLTKKELTSTKKPVLMKMQSTTSIEDSATLWDTGFEGLGANDSQRKVSEVQRNAQSIKDIFKLDYSADNTKSPLNSDGKDAEAGSADSATDIADELKCDTPAQSNGQKSGASVANIPDKYKGQIKFSDDRTTTYPDNKYPFGQCTWYVYNRMKQTGHPLPWFSGDGGNGGYWGEVAKQQGFNVEANKPHEGWAVSFKGGQFGAIAPYGHIAFVEHVNDDGSFLVSECNVMNPGSGTISFREISSGQGLNFIEGK
ncbi:surface antigen [Weissella oryzae SG25]|uniref:Surface antigen n=1 Tax=Weissella oryzae (strain DSM 25784 / JCM 18191 / LMG 30913 / SG25) TaxID=1329250 RepID=A0A069CU44_WEIOS|nr:phage tail tip lysozyme [Weissella oryzae]GAK30743.1 surface antigen [Weissella oryzae SG25]